MWLSRATGPDLRIMVYTAEPGTEDAERLTLLAVVGTPTIGEAPEALSHLGF
jgi:hypothetical protein